jgi:hypothetical protein
MRLRGTWQSEESDAELVLGLPKWWLVEWPVELLVESWGACFAVRNRIVRRDFSSRA